MIDYYYKFSSEEEAKQVLNLFVNKDKKWITSSINHSLDVVGTISSSLTASIEIMSSEENAYIPAYTYLPLEGWHINIRLSNDVLNLPDVGRVYPENPVRRWA
jgi:hypothetical protein